MLINDIINVLIIKPRTFYRTYS